MYIIFSLTPPHPTPLYLFTPTSVTVGDTVYGAGIPPGTVVTAVGTPSTSDGSAFEWKVWISTAITACPSSCLGVSLTFYPQTMDFDLSTSTPPDSSTASENVVSAMKNALGLENYLVADIGVFNGVYYGILSQYKFSAPSGVAVYDSGLDSQVFVADYGDKSLYMMGDAGMPYSVAAVKNNANRAQLWGVAVGTKSSVSDAKLWFSDQAGVAGARYMSGGYTGGSLDNVGTFSAGSNRGVAVDATTGDLYVVLYESSENKVVKVAGGVSGGAETDFITGLNHPSGVAVYGTGSTLKLYVSDTDSHVIKQYTVAGSTSIFVKNVGASAIPSFSYPTGELCCVLCCVLCAVCCVLTLILTLTPTLSYTHSLTRRRGGGQHGLVSLHRRHWQQSGPQDHAVDRFR